MTPELLTTIDHLLAAIDAGDRDTLPILADAFEEAGDPRAAGVRWLVQTKRFPCEWISFDNSSKLFWWYNHLEFPGWEVTEGSLLPSSVFDRMKKSGLSTARYEFLSEAILDAAQAYIASRKS